MSLYQIGHEIRFIIPGAANSYEARGTILEVPFDTARGAVNDSYTVEVNEPFSTFHRNTYTIGNDEVSGVLGVPTLIPTESRMIWGNPGTTIAEGEEEDDDDDDFFDDPSDEEEAEVEEEVDPEEQNRIEAALARSTSRSEFLSRNLEEITRAFTVPPAVPRASRREAPQAVAATAYVTSMTPTPRVPTDIVYNEVENPTPEELSIHTFHGVFPIGMLNVEGVRIPVYEAAHMQALYSVTARDYKIATNSRRFLRYSVNGLPISPSYDTHHGLLVYRTGEGQVLVNEYMEPRVTNVNYFRDNCRVKWAIREELWRYFERTGQNIQNPYPKKKLRRKYKEMPKIKEEKHYVGKKEFIA
jgi:hypothetical protein